MERSDGALRARENHVGVRIRKPWDLELGWRGVVGPEFTWDFCS